MEKRNLKRTLSIVAGSLVVALVVSIMPGNFFVSAAELSKREAEQIAIEKLIEFEELDEDTLVNISTSKVSPRNDDSYYSIIIKTEDGEYDLTVSSKDGEVKIENKLTKEKAIELAEKAIIKELKIDEENITGIIVDEEYATDGRRPYYIINVEVNNNDDRMYEVKVYVNNGRVAFDFEITEDEAEYLAIARISNKFDLNKSDLEMSDIDDDHADDSKNPYYIVTIEDNKSNEYKVIVYINNGRSVIVDEEDEDSEEVIESINFKEFIDGIGYEKDDDGKIEISDDYSKDYEKPTPEASLNMLLKDGKKAAIADFKESGNKEEFKEAKEILKAIKKSEKGQIKEVKKDNDEDDDDKDYDKSSLVKKTTYSEKQALIIALKKIDFPNLKNHVEKLSSDNISTEEAYAKILGLKELEIEKDDENPPAYEIEFIFENVKYEITVHARTGNILEFESKEIKSVKKEVKSEEKNDDKNNDKKINNNNKNNNGNNGNNGKGNNKNK